MRMYYFIFFIFFNFFIKRKYQRAKLTFWRAWPATLDEKLGSRDQTEPSPSLRWTATNPQYLFALFSGMVRRHTRFPEGMPSGTSRWQCVSSFAVWKYMTSIKTLKHLHQNTSMSTTTELFNILERCHISFYFSSDFL